MVTSELLLYRASLSKKWFLTLISEYKSLTLAQGPVYRKRKSEIVVSENSIFIKDDSNVEV